MARNWLLLCDFWLILYLNIWLMGFEILGAHFFSLVFSLFSSCYLRCLLSTFVANNALSVALRCHFTHHYSSSIERWNVGRGKNKNITGKNLVLVLIWRFCNLFFLSYSFFFFLSFHFFIFFSQFGSCFFVCAFNSLLLRVESLDTWDIRYLLTNNNWWHRQRW